MSGAAAMIAGLVIVPVVSLVTKHVPGMAFDEGFLDEIFGKAQAGSDAGTRAARAARQSRVNLKKRLDQSGAAPAWGPRRFFI